MASCLAFSAACVAVLMGLSRSLVLSALPKPTSFLVCVWADGGKVDGLPMIDDQLPPEPDPGAAAAAILISVATSIT